MTVTSKVKEYYNLINGKLVKAKSGETLDSIEPATGKVWAKMPKSNKEDVDLTVKAAQDAQPAWAALTVSERGEYLRSVAEIILENQEELMSIKSRDNGWVIRETTYGVPGVLAQYWNDAAGAAITAARGDTVKVSPTSQGYTFREPLGVVLGILPFNAPLFTFTIKAAYALAAGNTVVIKPSQHAAISSLRLGELLNKVLPPGVINVISGLGREIGDDLSGHKGINRVTLTGSSGSAEAIVKATAKRPIPLTLELGGKSPNIVFEDADLSAALEGVVQPIFGGNAGEICASGSRILVQRSVFDELTNMIKERLKITNLGDPLDPNSAMGPVANQSQFDKIKSYIEIGKNEGEIIFGGRSGGDVLLPDSPEHADGYWIEPTLIKTEDNSLRVCQEEIFGPVAVILPFDTEEEAIELANDTELGLASGVWTKDLSRAHRMIDKIEAGNVWVNTYARVGVDLPFGGVKASGYGNDEILSNTREKASVIEID